MGTGRAELCVEVKGEPVPQGSMRAFTSGGRAYVTHANTKLKAWRQQVKLAIEAERVTKLDGPLLVGLSFVLTRPKSAKRTQPWVKPDLDKLTRAVLDALTDSGAITDDSQVCEVTSIKRYVREGEDPGVCLFVKELSE